MLTEASIPHAEVDYVAAGFSDVGLQRDHNEDAIALHRAQRAAAAPGPKLLLERLLAHPDRDLALRFPPRNEGIPVRAATIEWLDRQPAPSVDEAHHALHGTAVPVAVVEGAR